MGFGGPLFRQGSRQCLCWEIAGAIPLGLTPIEDHPQPLQDTPGCLRTRQPRRCDYRQQIGTGDDIDGLLTDGFNRWMKRLEPLRFMLRVAKPSRIDRVDVRGGIHKRGHDATTTLDSRITARTGHLPQPCGFFSGIGE